MSERKSTRNEIANSTTNTNDIRLSAKRDSKYNGREIYIILCGVRLHFTMASSLHALLPQVY